MASMQKSYFLAPSWSITPDEVALGSIVANPKTPQRALSAGALTGSIDTKIHQPPEESNCSGTAKKQTKWSAGLFAKFVQGITVGGEASYSSDSIVQVDYSCESLKTRRFTPSLSYVTKATEDVNVKSHLKMGGFGAKVFMITGVKIASNITITTTEEKSNETIVKAGVDIQPVQVTIGPKGSYDSSKYNQHTRTISGPIVFAFEIEKIRVNLRGRVQHGEYIDGAMLAKKDGHAIDYVIERAGSDLDEDEIDDFGVTIQSGTEDETGVSCEIIVP